MLVARIAADEFALLFDFSKCNRQEAEQQLREIANTAWLAFSQPLKVGDELVSITVSVGAGFLVCDAEDTPLGILRHVNTALQQAKAAGGNRVVIYDPAFEKALRERFAIERDLRKGIATGELRLYLQPQVNKTGQIVGFEALVRWQHPQHGIVPPGVFIPVAEDSELIIELGDWVLTEACQLLTQLNAADKLLPISVNVSPKQFHQPDFAGRVKEVLRKTGADANHLVLEVTEGLMITDKEAVIAKMNELSSLGVRFSIDDFGTGYSSLAYLKRMPISELKIDKSFVQDIAIDSDDAAIVKTIISIAEHFNLTVVAEGVETEEQVAFLNPHKNVIYQGYLFGKPEPVEVWLKHLSIRKTN